MCHCIAWSQFSLIIGSIYVRETKQADSGINIALGIGIYFVKHYSEMACQKKRRIFNQLLVTLGVHHSIS